MMETSPERLSSSRTPTLNEPRESMTKAEVPLREKENPHFSSTSTSVPQEDAREVDAKALEAGLTDEKKDDEVIMVNWDGPDDPENPKNWTFKKKWAATAIVSAFTFISPVSSSMVAPAANQIAQQFDITNTVVMEMTISIFILAYAVGPLFLGPMSELYGRSRVLQAANIFYLIWNLACGFAQNKGQLIAFRFLSGLGGSAPLAIGGGVLGDCWATEERGQAIALYSLAPLLGPVVGPIAGAWIAERSTWRWVFWSTSIADGVVQVLGSIYLRETFAPILLERKANKIKKSMGIALDDQHRVRTPFQTPERHWRPLFAKAIVRPFALFIREPIIQVLGIYMAFLYGLIYLTITSMPGIFEGVYGERVGIAGLHYLAFGIGLSVASQINSRVIDRVYIYFRNRNGGVGRPEFRLPSMVPGAIITPVGLLMFGWGAQEHVPWIVPDIGIALVGAGLILNFQSVQTYVIDAFTLHAASALASVSCLRSLAGFGFPLFAPAMYKALGYGKGNTILAAFAIAVGCPAPFLLWYYGERIRNRSRYAGSPK